MASCQHSATQCPVLCQEAWLCRRPGARWVLTSKKPQAGSLMRQIAVRSYGSAPLSMSGCLGLTKALKKNQTSSPLWHAGTLAWIWTSIRSPTHPNKRQTCASVCRTVTLEVVYWKLMAKTTLHGERSLVQGATSSRKALLWIFYRCHRQMNNTWPLTSSNHPKTVTMVQDLSCSRQRPELVAAREWSIEPTVGWIFSNRLPTKMSSKSKWKRCKTLSRWTTGRRPPRTRRKMKSLKMSSLWLNCSSDSAYSSCESFSPWISQERRRRMRTISLSSACQVRTRMPSNPSMRFTRTLPKCTSTQRTKARSITSCATFCKTSMDDLLSQRLLTSELMASLSMHRTGWSLPSLTSWGKVAWMQISKTKNASARSYVATQCQLQDTIRRCLSPFPTVRTPRKLIQDRNFIYFNHQFAIFVRDVNDFNCRLEMLPGESNFAKLTKKFEQACRDNKLWYEDI